MNHQLDLTSISFAIASLQQSRADGTSAGAQSLGQVLSSDPAPLDFLLANYLAAFKIDSYMGRSVADYIQSYRDAPHYEIQAFNIAASSLWLYSMGSLSKPQAFSILDQLYGDPMVSVGTKLYIENEQFEFNVL